MKLVYTVVLHHTDISNGVVEDWEDAVATRRDLMEAVKVAVNRAEDDLESLDSAFDQVLDRGTFHTTFRNGTRVVNNSYTVVPSAEEE